IKWFGTKLAIATYAGSRVILSAHRGLESPVGGGITKDKLVAKQLLLKAGVATPRGRAVKTSDEAIIFRDEIGGPIVVKPRFGNTGRGVSVNLINTEDIHNAFATAAEHGDVIVEEFVEMVSEYRCLATKNRCVSVTQRLLPSVQGDGSSTIEELIRIKNESRQNIVSGFNRPTPI